jgi:hypothetical protein
MSKRANSFTVKWEAYDVYRGGARPQSFVVDPSEIEEDMDDDALEGLFYARLNDDFRDKVSAGSHDLEAFVDWARGVIAARAADDENEATTPT